MTTPDSPPATQYPSAQVTGSGPAPTSGLAIAALVIGVVAFVSGLAPFWGLISGGAAVGLGILALVKKQSKGMAVTGAILGGLAVLASLGTTVALVAGLAGFRSPSVSQPPVTQTENSSPATTETKSIQTPSPVESVEPEPAKPVETVSQENAKRSAVDYLNYTAFSRSGLIDQLVYEGFSVEDATYGVDATGADWNEQAALSAANYLDYTSFSHSGLVDQLIFEGFSPEEAEYGVSTTGL